MAAQSMTRSGVGVVPPAHRGPGGGAGWARDVHADQADPAEHGGQVQVGGPDHLDAVDVDQLVIEHVSGQHHLSRATGRSPRRSRRADCSSDLGVFQVSMAEASTKANRRPTRTTRPVTGG